MSRGSWSRRASIIVFILLATAASFSASSDEGARQGDRTLVYPPWKHTLGLNRVGQAHLDLYSGYRKKFSRPQGIAAVKLRFLDRKGRRDDDELTVYGINSGTGEIFYNKSMTSLGFLGGSERGLDDFRGGVGIAADADGNVYVADAAHDRVIRLRHTPANELEAVGAIDLAATGRPFRGPAGVAVGGGRLYVADTGNDRVVETSLSGGEARDVTTPGGVQRPFAIDVLSDDEWNFYGVSFAVVSDSNHARLVQLSLDGRTLAVRRLRDISDRPGGFWFVAVDYHANVYVTDSLSGCLYKFDRRLQYLTRIGCEGQGPHDLVEPRGIAIHRRFGQVFVAEKAGASYFWVGTDVRNLAAVVGQDGGGRSLDLRFLLTEQSLVSAGLENENGDEVFELFDSTFMSPGLVKERFPVPGEVLAGRVADCNLLLVVRARPTYSSRSFHTAERRTCMRER